MSDWQALRPGKGAACPAGPRLSISFCVFWTTSYQFRRRNPDKTGHRMTEIDRELLTGGRVTVDCLGRRHLLFELPETRRDRLAAGPDSLGSGDSCILRRRSRIRTSSGSSRLPAEVPTSNGDRAVLLYFAAVRPRGRPVSEIGTGLWPTVVELRGLEPLTLCLQSRCSSS